MSKDDRVEQKIIIPQEAGNKLYCLVKKNSKFAENTELKDFFTTEKSFMTQGDNGYSCGTISTPSVLMYNRFGFRVIARIMLGCHYSSNLAISIVFDYNKNVICLHSHNLYLKGTVKYKEHLFTVKYIEAYEQFKASKGSEDELEIQKEFVKKFVKKFLSHQLGANNPVKTIDENSEGFILLEEAIDDGIKKGSNQNANEVGDFIIQQRETTSPIDKIKKCTNEIKKASDNSYMLATSVANLFFVSCVSLAIAISSRYFILKSPINILHLKFALLAASSVFALSALCLAIKFALVSRSMIKNNMLEQKLHLKELFAEEQFDIANSTTTDLTTYDEIHNKISKYLKQFNQNIIILSLNFKAYAGKKLSDTELEIKKNYLKDRKYSTKINFLTTLSIYFFAIATIPAMSLFYYFGEVAKAPQSLKIVGYVCLSLTCISAIATVALYTESIVRGLSKIKENQTTEQDPNVDVVFYEDNCPINLFELTSKDFFTAI